MKKNIFILILFFSVSCISNIMYGAISANERAALIALYNSTRGDAWKNNAGWKTPPLHTDGFAMPGTEGSWVGITVQSDHVTRISMYRNYMRGTLPAEIENLEYLNTLFLGWNNLYGYVPPELGNLSNLKFLDLTYCRFSGSIPPQLGNLYNLIQLRISSNLFVGSIPPELGNLRNLQYINLSSMKLSGNIPPQLGNLSKLTTMYLCINQLSGPIPAEFGNLSNLQLMNLHRNQLSGNIPASFGNLRKLEIIHLFENNLSGSLPPEIGNMSRVQKIHIADNQLSGSLPPQIGNLPNIKELLLHSNKFTGNLPTSLGNLVNLTVLVLRDNYFSGEIPSSLTNLSRMETLNIANNCLYAVDTNLRDWLNLHDPDWEESQNNCLGPTGTITITAPNGGENWAIGSSQTITWTTTGEVGDLSVEYTTNNGLNWTTITHNTANTGSYSWIVPNTVSSQCRVRVSEVSGSSSPDMSDDFFSIIQEPKLTVATPNGGESWMVGTSHSIKWVTEGTVENVKIEYTPGGGKGWTTIIPSTPNTGTYNWTVPNTVSKRCKIKISGVPGGSPTDISDRKFSIVEIPAITITSPKGGESWITGSFHAITWTNTGTVVNVKIEYTENNGADWSEIISSIANNGTYNWLVPNTVSSYCKVRISEVGDADPSAVSDGFFSIVSRPELRLNRTRLNFCTMVSSTTIVSSPQEIRIDQVGDGILNWEAGFDVAWFSCFPVSGSGSGLLTVSANPAGLTEGTYVAALSVADKNADNSPQTVIVTLTVKNGNDDMPPFGEFSSPPSGKIVSGSIPVTGWVLDDIGIEHVKIYIEDKQSLSFIADAVFVEDARPDVEVLYPGYPFSYKAGWGYMGLTNVFPNGGNGAYKLHAVATDKSGTEVTLGIKNITVDNANAVKPFGTIETPTQGGIASGNSFINWGWVLTPQPNIIPNDGSTIRVWVDGVNIGHPVYNNYRKDIAVLFPGYANSDGAFGYFYLDTTTYRNGTHTIAWTVQDSAGNVAGIGSRYFTVQNPGGISRKSSTFNLENSRLFPSSSCPARIKKGFMQDSEGEEIYPDEEGIMRIEIKEMERLELHLSPGIVNLTSLPAGSTLDTTRGIFYWQPGPGFIGDYEFDFVVKGRDGRMEKIKITVLIIN